MARPKAYHHGDLRAALVKAGLAAVDREGPDVVSLRELARTLGVSRAAPYRHFEDRRALLVAVAAEGFRLLIGSYEKILAEGLGPRARARALNRAFLDLAEQRPGLFQLMFESDLLAGEEAPGELAGLARNAFLLPWGAAKATRPDLDPKIAKARVIAVWSALYGFMALRRSGKLKRFMIDPLTDDELTEAVLDFISGGRGPDRS